MANLFSAGLRKLRDRVTADAASDSTLTDPASASPAATAKGRTAAGGSGLAQALEEVRVLKQAGRNAEAAELLIQTYRRQEDPVVGYRLVATLLDLRRYADILSFPSARPHNSRDHAVAEHLLAVDVNGRPDLCIESQPAWEQLGYVTMIKDEQDIILFNLVWHYALGVRRFFIIDNLSTDRTGELIRLFQQRFADASVQVLSDSVVAHFQGRKVSGACWFMKALWPDLSWIILADADEFICPERPLRELLSAVGPDVDAVVLPKSVYRLTPGDPLDDVAWFFERMRRRQPLSHVSIKIIARAQVGLEIAQGNHRVLEHKGYTEARYVSLVGLTMREYPVRSLAQFQRKIISGGRAIEAAKQSGLSAVGGDHWVNLYRQYQERGPQALAARMSAEVAANDKKADIADPLPLDDVMSRLMPDWRQCLALPGTDKPD